MGGFAPGGPPRESPDGAAPLPLCRGQGGTRGGRRARQVARVPLPGRALPAGPPEPPGSGAEPGGARRPLAALTPAGLRPGGGTEGGRRGEGSLGRAPAVAAGAVRAVPGTRAQAGVGATAGRAYRGCAADACAACRPSEASHGGKRSPSAGEICF